jgi:hypothetical protein
MMYGEPDNLSHSVLGFTKLLKTLNEKVKKFRLIENVRKFTFMTVCIEDKVTDGRTN